MSDSENPEQNAVVQEEEKAERYFDYYIKKNTMWISIFLSLFLLLDIIAVFVSTNYTFFDIFLYFGLLMMLFAAVILYFIWREKNYFWALLASIFLGLTPLIEIIIQIARVTMSTTSLVFAILSLLIALTLAILPILLVYLRYYREFKDTETDE
jgi:hypothetical protein